MNYVEILLAMFYIFAETCAGPTIKKVITSNCCSIPQVLLQDYYLGGRDIPIDI